MDRDGWIQLSFRAPAAVEEFVMTMCVKRKITFQTLILELLRNLGAPVSDPDLQDNRKGRKAPRSGSIDGQGTKPSVHGRHNDNIDRLGQLRDPHFWERVAQQGSGQTSRQLPGTLQVIFANFAGDKAR